MANLIAIGKKYREIEALRRAKYLMLTTIVAVIALSSTNGCATDPSASGPSPFQGSPDLILPGVAHATGLMKAALNSDGRMYLLVLSGTAPRLGALLIENGPKFSVRKVNEFDVGASASAFCVGDYNGDGKLDVAVCHHDTDEVWLFFGKGDGTFQPHQKIHVPVTKPHCHAIVAADINHDGHLDLLLAESDDNCAWVFLGDGHGKFVKSPGSPVPTGGHPYVVATADFNRDGELDMATPNWSGKSVSVFLGDGKLKFRSSPGSPLKGLQNPTAIAIGDLNADRNLDIVVGNNGSRGLQVFFGDGKGVFRPGPDLDPDGPCYRPVLADLNGDGRLDVLATATNDARTFSYWINEGAAKFSPAHALPCPDGANTLLVTDLNGDGTPDIAVGTEKGSSTLVWLGRKQS